jgi:hypothetical protein
MTSGSSRSSRLAPEDLYDVINERYERGSILLTSNRAPNEWPDLFQDPTRPACWPPLAWTGCWTGPRWSSSAAPVTALKAARA